MPASDPSSVESIAARILARVAELGLTLEALPSSVRKGVTKGWIKGPTIETLMETAAVLRVPLLELVGAPRPALCDERALKTSLQLTIGAFAPDLPQANALVELTHKVYTRLMTAARERPGPEADLYNADLLDWSEQQAALLRRLAAGERVDAVDWPRVIEEVESVGRDQLHTVASFLVQATLHELKAQAWPRSREVPRWQAEARRFRGEAIDRYTPSMRQRLDLAKIYRRALRALPDTIDGQRPLPLPKECSVSLDALLAEEE